MRWSDTWAAAAGLALLDAASWAVWLTDQGGVQFGLLATTTVVAAVLMAQVVPRQRGALAASLVLVVPVAGPVVAAWATSTRGCGTADLLADPDAKPRSIDAAELARRLTCALPPCEALVSRDGDVRRAAIARLATRASAEDVNLLRWARTMRDPDAAAEIALALEDLEERFARQLRAARAAASARPEVATHATLFELIARAVLAGIVDNALVPKLAAEARRHHDAAVALDPERAGSLLATRVRLELAARRPEPVLALLERAFADDPTSELGKLYLEAAYASRAFDHIPIARRMTTRAT